VVFGTVLEVACIAICGIRIRAAVLASVAADIIASSATVNVVLAVAIRDVNVSRATSQVVFAVLAQ
jgi:hypothetical protein